MRGLRLLEQRTRLMSQQVLFPENASAADDADDVLALGAATKLTSDDRGNARLEVGADTAMWLKWARMCQM